jgi:hypothetical protein
MGFASQDVPFNIPHCIARHINPQQDQGPRFSVCDQVCKKGGGSLNSVGCMLTLQFGCINNEQDLCLFADAQLPCNFLDECRAREGI